MSENIPCNFVLSFSISRILVFGNLSISIFLPVFPIDMYSRLTSFLLAGTSSKFPITAATLGFCWSASRRSSVVDIECLDRTASSKSCTHCFQSYPGGFLPPARTNQDPEGVNSNCLLQLVAPFNSSVNSS